MIQSGGFESSYQLNFLGGGEIWKQPYWSLNDETPILTLGTKAGVSFPN